MDRRNFLIGGSTAAVAATTATVVLADAHKQKPRMFHGRIGGVDFRELFREKARHEKKFGAMGYTIQYQPYWYKVDGGFGRGELYFIDYMACNSAEMIELGPQMQSIGGIDEPMFPNGMIIS
jgi:hypothetical protein